MSKSNAFDNSNLPSRFALPRLGIAVQVYFAVLVMALALLVTQAAAWLDAGQQAQLQSEREIDDGLEGFQSDANRATREVAALGIWLVDQKAFVELVQARDGARLAKYLEPWTEMSIVDSILVSDKNGIVLAQSGDQQTSVKSVSILDLPGITDTLAGKKITGVAQDRGGRLQGRVLMPVYAPETNSPIGTLLLAFYFDGSFLQYRFRKLNQEIAVVYNDKVYIITLTDTHGNPWGGNLAPANVLKAQREGRASAFVPLETEIGNYLFKFKPFQSPLNASVAMYGVGVSTTSVDALRTNIFRTFGVGSIVIAVGMGFAVFFFGRTLTRPIRALSDAARAMANGDLVTPIQVARNDELGDLARQMDQTRQQLRLALQSITLERGRYAAVIQYMGVAAIITDQHLNIAAVNSAAEILLKQDQAALLGQPWHHVFGVDGKGDSADSALWTLGETEKIGDQTLIARGRFPLRARPHVRLDVISTQVQVEGEPAGFVHILQDASAQEQLVRAKDEFIMNAAHEFRSPLASLRASIELLVEDYATMGKQDLNVMLRAMQRAVVKFQGLVENLIDVGNIQAGRFRVRPIPVRLNSLIEDALAQVNPLLQGRSQFTQVDCPASCVVLADRARITQVLINLLSNASKYGPEGESIVLSVSSKDGFAIAQVTDHGPGIQPEEQSQLFQRFYRGRRAEEEGIGIGLGLALAREIVQAHGGQIGVTSAMGAGTTFWFSLPQADQA